MPTEQVKDQIFRAEMRFPTENELERMWIGIRTIPVNQPTTAEQVEKMKGKSKSSSHSSVANLEQFLTWKLKEGLPINVI